MQDNPFADLIPQQGAQTPGIIYGRPKQVTPIEAAREQRAVQDQAWQQQSQIRAERAADRADATAARAAAADDRRAAIDAKRLAKEDQLTEGQAKDTNFYNALIGAERDWRNISSNPETRPGTEAPGIAGDAVRGVLPRGWVNSLSSTERQQANQAKENFIRATLRLESGAAIVDSEFYRQDQIFFPQTGDSPEVIAQKARARQQAINGFRIASGPGAAKVDNLYGLTTNDRGEVNLGVNEAPAAVPQNQAAGGQVQFAGEGAQMRSGFGKLTDEQFAEFQRAAQSGASAERLAGMAAAFGMPSDAEGMRNLEGIAAFYAKPENRNVPLGVDYSRSEVQAVNPGDGAIGAAARGAGNALTLGFLDEAGALADTVTQGGTYSDNLDRRRGQELYDEQNNGGSRLAGQLAGGLLLPSFGASTPRQLAALGGAYGGIYGAGSADGGAGDRLAGGAIGGATGAAGGYALARLGQAAVARLGGGGGGGGNPQGRALLEAAQRQGVDVLPQDVAQGPMIGRATAGLAQTPFGTNPIRAATDRLYNSFKGRVSELAGPANSAAEVGGAIKDRAAAAATRQEQMAERTAGEVQQAIGEGGDLTSAGQAARRGVTRWMEQTNERANQLYRAVPIEANAPASTTATQGVLRDLTRGMESNPEVSALFANGRLSALRRALTDEVDPATGEVTRNAGLSWGDLQELRTRVGDMLDEPRLSEKIAPRQLRALYSGLTQDMEATATQQGGDALRAWRRANGYYAARMGRIEGAISKVIGDRTDRTPNEVMSNLTGMLREGRAENASGFGQFLRSLPREDAAAVRSAIVQDARGGRAFDANEFAKAWEKMSERGKSQLLPQPGLRNAMDDAAARAAQSTRDPLANLSAEQVINKFESMAQNRGDSAKFAAEIASMAPEEAQSLRALLINRMGAVREDASGGEVFSIKRFLDRYTRDMTKEAKSTLFGNAELRQHMDDLARIAEGVSRSEALRGHSNTGAINSLNATTGGLGGAAVALLTGHPIVAAGLTVPAITQKVGAELLTSPMFLRWVARAPRSANGAANRAHLSRLATIAAREPAIANDILPLQQALQQALPQVAAEGEPQQRRR